MTRESADFDGLTEHSPAGLSAPDCEIEDGTVVCPHCGNEFPVSETHSTADIVSENDNGAVLDVSRKYVCSEDCGIELMFGGGL